MATTECYYSECGKTLTVNDQGIGDGISRGPYRFCSVDHYHAHQRSEITRVIDEMTSDED